MSVVENEVSKVVEKTQMQCIASLALGAANDITFLTTIINLSVDTICVFVSGFVIAWDVFKNPTIPVTHSRI